MDFRHQWFAASAQKNSLLCVGIDPAEAGQRQGEKLPQGMSKIEWTLHLIKSVAPFAACIKLNRNYFKDLSRSSMQELNAAIHVHGMLSIDDSKLADIGDTNDSGLYHAKQEGFDAVTYAAFPGNTQQAAAQARQHQIGLIPLVLMSNPEFAIMKSAKIGQQPLFLFLAQEAAKAEAAGVVIGAPSPNNHITESEIELIASLLPEALVLVPGVGAQGGELGSLLKLFGPRLMVNVGRAIIYASHPAKEAQKYNELIADLRQKFKV